MDKSLLLVAAGGAAIGLGLYWAISTKKLRMAVTGPPPPGAAASEPLIRQLHPDLQDKARELLQRAINIGIPLVVASGYRSADQQAAAYAQGRTAPGPIVTNAPPGSSWHNFGRAFDVAVLDGNTPTWPNDVALWARVGAAGKATGLEWGGDFATIVDRPHFQDRAGMTLSQARAGLAGLATFRLAA